MLDIRARATSAGRALTSALVARAAIALLLAGCIAGAGALLTAGRPALSADESLYLSEAISIATGHGPVYSTGETVVHRPFLFPALLAGVVKATGADSANVYWLPRLAALAAAASLAILVGRASGALVGAAAAALALASAQLNRLGNSLYVDVTETLFLILALLALSGLHRRPSLRAYTAAGILISAAFWTKESALLLTPLPFALLAFTRRPATRRDMVGLACYTLAIGIPLVAWWLWVAAHAGSTYLIGAGTTPAGVIATAPFAVAGILLSAALRMRADIRALPLRRAAGAVFLLVWHIVWLWGLETHSWPYSHNYLASVPRYLWEVGPNVQPFFLLLPAWLYIGRRALRGDQACAQMLVAGALFLPFFTFTANRFLDLRDSLLLVYLSFAAIAITVIDAARYVFARVAGHPARAAAAAAGAVAIALAVVPQVARNYATGLEPHEVSGSADWNGSVARGAARWIEQNVPPDTTIMTSRLYYSSIFSLTNGNYTVVQLPMLRVQFNDTQLHVMSTQFRWEDDELWRYGDGQWLYLRRYPQKGYDIGLTQTDLLEDLRRRDVRYLIITGEDAGFSSFTFLDYFLDAPGLQLIAVESAHDGDAAYIFAVDAHRLAPRPFPMTMSRATEKALGEDLGAGVGEAMRRLAPSLRISPEMGMPAAARALLNEPEWSAHSR